MRCFLRTADHAAIQRRLGAPFDPAHLVGMTVVAEVEPEFHPRWGMGGRMVGLSEALRESLARRRLDDVRKRLRIEGLYDRQRRLPSPADVVRVAVIHPDGAAGHADIAGELARWERAGIVTVTAVTAPFEGPRAAPAIAAALTRAVSGGSLPDVVLLIRGGGDKAGLMALDDERVARAVCNCTVPVITGLGHAVDRSLVDEVAWAACDTPSKALARLAALIVEPARRARADLAIIRTEAERRVAVAASDVAQTWTATLVDAERRVTAAHHDVRQTRDAVTTGAERRLSGATAALAGTWTVARAGIAGARERCAAMEREVASLFDAVRERAPLGLDAVARDLERLRTEAMAAARSRLDRADDGAGHFKLVLTRAGARLDTASADIAGRIAAVPLDAARRLTDAGIDLAQVSTLVESLGLSATLARGFALATTRTGALVPTRTAAIAAGEITLTFTDGAVTARVGALPTTDINGDTA